MNSSASNSLPELSKTLSAFFLFVQIIFGFRFGFMKPISDKILFEKMYCVIVPGALMNYFIFIMFSEVIVMVFLHFLEYFSCMFVLLLTNYTLYDYLLDFAVINKDSDGENDKNIGAKVAIFTILCFLFKCVVSTLFCFYSVTYLYCSSFSLEMFLYIWVTVGVDIQTVVQILIIYMVYKGTKNIEVSLKTERVSVKQALKRYIEVSDTVDKVIPMFDKLFMVGVLVNIPKGMFITYNALLWFKDHQDWVVFGTSYSYVVHLGFLLCLPAAMGQMVVIQYNSIKLTLHNFLIHETDKQTRREIKWMLRYICGRPMEHNLWRVIPLDLRLPASLFSMFVTYLIITIQFTHLFD